MNKDKQEILMKNNIMIKAKYNLSTIENKVFQMILFNFQKQDNYTLVAEIELDKFKELIKRRNDKTVEAISNMLEKLRESSIEIKTDKKWLRYGFISGATFHEDTQIFEIEATKKIYDLLFNYLKGYTPVNLPIFLSFKSFYSQRFYELLRLWSNTKNIINYSIEELRDLLMLNKKHIAYCDFKKRVINPAIKELNEKSLMQVDIKEHKLGRKVISIDFIVTDNDKRKYFEDDINSKIIQDKEKVECNNLKFNNFEQRNYDYNDLEKKLLGWDNEE